MARERLVLLTIVFLLPAIWINTNSSQAKELENLTLQQLRSVLFSAIDSGHIDSVKLFLEKDQMGKLLEAREPNSGRTALFTAAYEGQKEIFEYLLEKGAKIDTRDKQGCTVLHAAARNKTKDMEEYLLTGDMAKLLLSKKIDVNVIDSNGETPLYYVIYKEVTEFLIANGADVNFKNPYGRTPLHRISAEESGFRESTRMNEKVADKTGAYLGITELLIQHGADVNALNYSGETPIFRAVGWYGSAEIVSLLIKSGAFYKFPNNNGETPLHCAAWDGNLEVAKVLVKAEAPVNCQTIDLNKHVKNVMHVIEGVTPLHWAARSRGYKKDEHGKYILDEQGMAARNNDGNPELVAFLIASGAWVNMGDEGGATPLHYAAEYNKPAAIKALIDNGANPYAETKGGTTPLMRAVQWHSYKAIDMLKSYGVTR